MSVGDFLSAPRAGQGPEFSLTATPEIPCSRGTEITTPIKNERGQKLPSCTPREPRFGISLGLYLAVVHGRGCLILCPKSAALCDAPAQNSQE